LASGFSFTRSPILRLAFAFPSHGLRVTSYGPFHHRGCRGNVSFEKHRVLAFACHPESPPGVRDLGFDLRLSRFLTRLWRFGMTSFAFSFYVSSPALACFSTLNLTPKKLFNFSVVLCALTYTDSMPTRSPCLWCNPEVFHWPRVFRSHAPRSFALLLPFRVTGH